jgi:membrane peptidoglycan carboxypeptidase
VNSLPRYLLIVCAVVCLTLFASAGTLFFVARIPLPTFEASKETLLLDSAGQVLAPLTGTLRSQPLQLKELPQSLINATLAIEDRRFYEHRGFDWRGIARAATVNLREQKKSQGASTVTQQLARNLFLSHEKTWLRKGKEAIFTVQLEQQWNKQLENHDYQDAVLASTLQVGK